MCVSDVIELRVITICDLFNLEIGQLEDRLDVTVEDFMRILDKTYIWQIQE